MKQIRPTKKKGKHRGKDGRRPGVILKARTRRKRNPSEESDDGKILPIQRTPETIIDTRLHDAEEKGKFRCDSCTSWFRGSYKGRLLPEVRELSFQELMEVWQDGSVDASWYCVECWKIYFREERLGLRRSRVSGSTTRAVDGHGAIDVGRTVGGGRATTSTAASSTAPTTRLRDQATSAPGASPRRLSGATSGRLGNGMPHSRAGHASRSCGRSQRRPSRRGYTWT